MYKFKAGDKVRVNEHGNYFFTTAGSEGEVVAVYDYSCWVKFTKMASGKEPSTTKYHIAKKHLDIINK